MTEEQVQAIGEEHSPDAEDQKEHFTPVASFVLMALYILIFALAWGLVYFNDLLARR